MTKWTSVLIAAGMLGASTALAQMGGEQQQQDPQQQQQQQEQQQQDPQQQEFQAPDIDASDVSEEELDSVANAYVKIIDIREQYQPSLANAEDPETAQEIQREANEEMVSAVEETDLDVETYNQIVMAAEADEELREQLFEKIDEVEAEEGGEG